MIGAGNFTQLRLLPGLKNTEARMKWIASSQGISSAHAARKFSFENNTTDYRKILKDDEVNTVFITTRHSLHAPLAIEALKAGKNVFVEKPLCIKPEELDQLLLAYEEACCDQSLLLGIGFNRRFSPLTTMITKIMQTRQQPFSATFTCNAGQIPSDHWTQDPDEGGGRIIGEAIHFIDYLHHLSGNSIVRVLAAKTGAQSGQDMEDNAAITLVFADGSIGQVNYFSGGAKNYPKEQMEVFFDGKILQLDNFKNLYGFGISSFRKKSLFRQDKGHAQGFKAFVEAIAEGKESPVSIESIINVHRASFAALELMRNGGGETLL